jgi:hypothetical protein
VDDVELLRLFQSCELPFDQWKHRTHVKVAYLYLRQYSFREALAQLGPAIQRYNAANKVPESETSGYNQTTTHALLHLIAAVMRAYEKTHPVDCADAFCDTHPQLMSKHVLRFFYSPGRRMDPRAKGAFVEPDLTALPRILGDEE